MVLSTDYLIVGAGAVGMAFADQLLTETDADIVMVDRRARPGGHWNDAYPFVRLHQPSAFYGVGSRDLGSGHIDAVGANAGHYELAASDEVRAYFDDLMRTRFLRSGRVRYYPGCEWTGEGGFTCAASSATRAVRFSKLVDTTYFDTSVPSLHQPAFGLEPGVRLVAPSGLAGEDLRAGRFVIVGGGKTAMDVAVWLLEQGVAPVRIQWIVPRDSWLINRDTTQPGDAFFAERIGGQAKMLEAAAGAISVTDLFERLERNGQLLRIDPNVWPTMYRGATISLREVDVLRRISDVVRLGRVLRIELNAVVLEQGVIPSEPHCVYVDCTAKGLGGGEPAPVFQGDRITVQMVRAGLICFSAALIAHVEAAYADEAVKNALCQPIHPAESDLDWLRVTAADLAAGRRWSSDPGLRSWIGSHRLSGFGSSDGGGHPEASALGDRLRQARPQAAANLANLIAAAPLQLRH